MSFIKKDDCYLDIDTNLEWSLENYGPMTWDQAQKQLPDGWRVPTRKELYSLIDDTLVDPCTKLPNMMSSYYWSATTGVDYTDYAWQVLFGYGYVYYGDKSDEYYVRAVRGEMK